MTIQEKIEAVFMLGGEDAEAVEKLIRDIVKDEIFNILMGSIGGDLPF
jgi:hypothetical protein